MDASGSRTGERGLIGPLAIVLVLGLVISGSVLVVVLGLDSFSSTQQSIDADRAEQSLTQFDSQTAMVALGQAETQQIVLSGVGAANYRVENESGWMRVTITNTSDGSTDTVMNTTLGAVVYDNGDTSVAYQGGGVWRQSANNGTTMVSPPEFHYRGATLTLPLVTVRGNETLSGRVGVTQRAPVDQRFPDPEANEKWVNPLESGQVKVTVKSQYYESWARFFSERTDGTAEVDPESGTATARLIVPTEPQTVSNAIAATSAGGEIRMAGSGGNPSRTDSYNSSVGTGRYADTRTNQGTIRTAGDVTVTGNSEVYGSIASGGSVSVKGAGVVTGDVKYTDGKKLKGTIGGTAEQISGIEGDGPVDSYVSTRYGNTTSENDNGDTGVPITDDALDSGDQTLGPGVYHLDRLDVDGVNLTLDTGADGDIVIGVRDYVRIANGGAINVDGSGQVRVYVEGENATGSGHHFLIENGGIVNVETAQNARQFWLYGHSDFQGRIDGSSSDTDRFEGVIYAPAGAVGSSSMGIEKGDVYGGAVAGQIEMDNGGAVHYDRSLKNVRAIPPEENIIRLTFLHISENPVAVTDD